MITSWVVCTTRSLLTPFTKLLMGLNSGIRPPADPKGSPFILFWHIHSLLTDLKMFLKAPSVPIYTNFEGERGPTFCPNFPKSAKKTLFSACVLKTYLRRRKFGQYRVFIVVWETSENQFGRPKKRKSIWSTKFSNFFWKSAPFPRLWEIPRSAPDYYNSIFWTAGDPFKISVNELLCIIICIIVLLFHLQYLLHFLHYSQSFSWLKHCPTIDSIFFTSPLSPRTVISPIRSSDLHIYRLHHPINSNASLPQHYVFIHL